MIDGIYLELHEAVALPCVTFFPPWISGSELGGSGPPSAGHAQRAPGDVPGPRPAEGVTTPGTKDGILSGFSENCHVGGVARGPKALSPRCSRGMAEVVGDREVSRPVRCVPFPGPLWVGL